MLSRITRRDFLAEASTAILASGSFISSGCKPQNKNSTKTPWNHLPQLEGMLSFDSAMRTDMAMDIGKNFTKMPAAVFRPKSVDDIVKIVLHANVYKLKVAMRGVGHSQYGQTLAENGIVIDSRSLDRITLLEGNMADVQAGASWNKVIEATLQRGLAPPALGDSMMISVGGILSSGGISNSSHLYGAIVDTIIELDVVTGRGELVTCSPQRNSELFDIVLAGMGQCGLITRARIKLIAIPPYVVRCNFNYANLKEFLDDYLRLANEGMNEHLGAYVLPRSPGENWKFRINIGKFCNSTDEYHADHIISRLKADSRDDPVTMTFADYLQREQLRDERNNERWKSIPTRLLFTTFFLPKSISQEFISGILNTPSETDKMLRFSIYALPRHLFSRPMLVLPNEDFLLSIFLFHEVIVDDEERYLKMVATVKKLSSRIRSAGGKLYPPYAPFFTSKDWQDHYGAKQWSRLVAAKQEYDPNLTLTPGMSIIA